MHLVQYRLTPSQQLRLAAVAERESAVRRIVRARRHLQLINKLTPMTARRLIAVALLAATLLGDLDFHHEGERNPHIEPHPIRVVRYVSERYMPKAEVVRLATTTTR